MKRTIVVAVLLGMFLSTGIASCGPTQKPTEVEVTQEALPTATLVPAVPEDKVVLEIMTWSENRVSGISHGECLFYTTSERLIKSVSRYGGVID